MSKSLVIVESPTKAKTLKKYLGKDFTVMASGGHIKDLPPKKLGVDINDNFSVEYEIVKGKKKIIDDIKKSAKLADKIYLAPDPDREGEAIAWHIAESLGAKNNNIFRVLFSEITKKGVLAAIEHPTKLNKTKYEAQVTRRILDRLVGYKISPLLWKKVSRGLSAGRVQSVALRVIVDRERDRLAFKVEEYWTIDARLETNQKKELVASLFKINDEKIQIKNEGESKSLVEDIERQVFTITDITKKERKRYPQPPYITSTLQQDASRKHGFGAERTMRIAQQLYEGIEIGSEGLVGLITYMRTDSIRSADEALMGIRDVIVQKYGKDYLPDIPTIYKTKKRAQDAHEAIRPTDLTIEPDTIKPHLTSNQYKLYRLIFERALASLMPDAEIIQKIIEMSGFDNNQGNPSAIFKTIGNTIHFDGFLKIYPLSIKEQSIPPLTLEEKATLTKLQPQQHFTEPPPRYNDASLVKELERRGIGRPSTYAPIIETILKRNYITRDENKRFIPTEIGTVVNQVLVEHFPHIVDYDFTAHMENELDDIAHKHKPWVDVVQEFFVPFEKNLEKKYKEVSKKELTEEKTDIQCPLCKKHNLIIKLGRYGRFLACPGFPDCTHTQPLETQQTSTQNGQKEEIDAPLCDTCNEKMIIKEGRFGKFFACKNYPKCKNTKAIEKKINMKCPLCTEGDVVVKRTKRGKTFYGCNTYPDCTFASWKKPETENSEQGITSSE